MNKLFIYLLAICWFIYGGCNSQKKSPHFFLDGYPQLIFKDSRENLVPTHFFIKHSSVNGVSTFEVRDTTLRLYERKSNELYSGYIRTYHWGMNNIEAVFIRGRIQKLRFWHPNRVLGQDSDYNTGIGKVWNFDGELSITWDEKEEIHRNPMTQRIRQVIEDSITTYFNFDGEITRYTIRTDSTFKQFYPDGSPRFFFPQYRNGLRNGTVRRWYPNGQLQAVGQYRNGKEFGTWIEYDSLGLEINRQIW